MNVEGEMAESNAPPAEPALSRQIGNTGARLWGEPVDGLTYDAEGHLQVGNNQNREHRALLRDRHGYHVRNARRIERRRMVFRMHPAS